MAGWQDGRREMSVMDQWPLQFSSVVGRSEIARRFCLKNNETPFLYT